MPVDYSEYPPDWLSIRERILLRAGNKCETCGIANYAVKPNGTKVILTIAHLDHDHKNFNVKDDRLKALCQGCHLAYDRSRHVKKRKYGKKIFEHPSLPLSAQLYNNYILYT
jgi:hypothetical protein